MRALCTALALQAALLLAACTGVDGHAKVTLNTPPQLSGQNAQAVAAYYNSPEFKLRHEDPRVPADYAEFKRISIYPLTYKVWKSPALMKAAGPRRVLIDLQLQRGFLYVNDEIAMDFPVCTGKEKVKIEKTGVAGLAQGTAQKYLEPTKLLRRDRHVK